MLSPGEILKVFLIALSWASVAPGNAEALMVAALGEEAIILAQVLDSFSGDPMFRSPAESK